MLISGLMIGLGASAIIVRAFTAKKKHKNHKAIVKTPSQLPDQNELAFDNAVNAANRGLNVSAASMGLAIAGTLIYPPLRLLAWIGLSFASAHFFKGAYRAVVEERKLNIALVDGFMMAGVFATGSLIAGTLASLLLYWSKKSILKTEDRSMKSLVNIFGEQPRTVWLLKEDVEVEIDFDQLRAGDTIVVNAGEVIAADGMIASGIASVDEHTLTGESQPAEKTIGDSVFATTILLSGKINIQVEKAGSESVAAKIGTLLHQTADFRATTESRWLKFADKSAPVTLGASITAYALSGPASAAYMLYACSYGYSMRIIAPATMLNFLNLSTKSGLLIKDGRSLDLLNKIDTVVFDKTGTLTLDQPIVGKIHVCGNLNEDDLLLYAAAAEHRQTHPVARAILEASRKRNLQLPEIDNAEYEIGYGIKVTIDKNTIHLGSSRFMSLEGISIPPEVALVQQHAHISGASLVMVAIDNQLAGVIELDIVIRPEAEWVVAELRKRDIDIYILSGDHEKPTQQLANKLGIENYFAETLPEDKAKLVKKLQDTGKSVCFIGDGINDAIALKQANVSISMSGATSVATDTAQIVLMDGSLKHLVKLFDIANNYHQNIKRSLLMTILPTATSVAGILLFHFGMTATVLLYYSGVAAGMVNASRPSYKQRRLQLASKKIINKNLIINSGKT